MIAVKDCKGNCRHYDAPVTYPVHRALRELQALGYRNNRGALSLLSESIGEDFTFILPVAYIGKAFSDPLC